MARPTEYLKMRYAAPPECCKCGDCQLVPPGELRAWDDEMQQLRMMLKQSVAENERLARSCGER